MAHEFCEAVHGGGFHFEIEDTGVVALEGDEGVDEIWEGYGQPKRAALRPIEAGAGDGGTVKVPYSEVLAQGDGCLGDIGIYAAASKAGVALKLAEEEYFLRGVAVLVVVQQIVEPDAEGRDNDAIDRNIGLETAAGAEADDGQDGFVLVDGAGLKVDIGKGIELVEHNIDIVWTNACAHNRDAFGAYIACVGNKFAVLRTVFDRVEIFRYFVHAIGVANGDDGFGEIFACYIEVVDVSFAVNDQF